MKEELAAKVKLKRFRNVLLFIMAFVLLTGAFPASLRAATIAEILERSKARKAAAESSSEETAAPAPAQTTAQTSPAGVSSSASINFPLGFRRGVNMGNMLEAPKEGEWGSFVRDEYFELIADAGFDHVRIPVKWSANLDGENVIRQEFMDRVTHVVDEALSNGLGVILNVHHFDEIHNAPSTNKEKLFAIWRQISERFKDRPNDKLMFEILNEPNGQLTSSVYNPIQNECISIIRKTNPERKILVSGGNWGSYTDLINMVLPADDNLVASFHYYDPFGFTHQGADWTSPIPPLGVTWNGTEEEKRAVESTFRQIKAWSEAAKIPVVCGEFGAYEKADLASRERWTTFVREMAEKYGFAFDYWEFNSGFGISNPRTNQFNSLLKCLIPAKPYELAGTGTGLPKCEVKRTLSTIGPGKYVRSVDIDAPSWCGYTVFDTDDGTVMVELASVVDWARIYIPTGIKDTGESFSANTIELTLRNIDNSIDQISINLATFDPEYEQSLVNLNAAALKGNGSDVRKNDDGTITVTLNIADKYSLFKGKNKVSADGVRLKLFIESSMNDWSGERNGSMELLDMSVK
ncbi:MAG: glycoside hydrolase family 5 protein [Clostridiales bacterium]|jgi:endoglucanase|nr:glycoside hydrolase family 5 protein [Clostridiales bacterium]